MAGKRKYELSVYSRGYYQTLFQDWAWAFSKKQAIKLIRDRLKTANDLRNLDIMDNQDLPFHVIDITARDADERKEKAKERAMRNPNPALVERHETCPQCGGHAEYDYCDNCGWQRYAGSSMKASVVMAENNKTGTNEDEEF